MINSITTNSAFFSGIQGLQNASTAIAQASLSIAAESANTATSNSLTNDLVSLQVNSINAQAAANVIDVADETLGRIIDTLA